MSVPSSVHLAILIVYGIYWVLGTIGYLVRRNYEPIKSRGVWAPLSQSTYGMIHFALLTLQEAYPIPCVYPYVSNALVILLWLFVSDSCFFFFFVFGKCACEVGRKCRDQFRVHVFFFFFN